MISTYFNHPIFVYNFLGIQFQYPILSKKFSFKRFGIKKNCFMFLEILNPKILLIILT
jgi:hypothetical protein